MTLAERYNNPGNVSLPIKGWTGGGSIVGASGQSGYASFPDMETGYAALQQRINDYITTKGYTTIRQIGSVYAEDLNWGNAVARISGIGKDTPLDPSNTAQMSALLGGIIRQETGKDATALGLDTSTGLGTAVAADPGLKHAYDVAGAATNTVDANSGDLVQAVDTQTEAQAAGSTILASATSQAGNAQASAITQATQAALDTQTHWYTALLDWMASYFVRGALVVLGLVIVALALYMLSQKTEIGQAAQSMAVSAAAAA